MTAQHRPLSKSYGTAYGKFARRGEAFDADEDAFVQAGFKVTKYNNNLEWQLEGHGLLLCYYPTTSRFICHGQSFCSSVPAVIAAAKSGRIRKAPGAKVTTCKLCQEVDIYWKKSPRDRWLAIEAGSGVVHFSRCQGQNHE
jgi:hypothetical protein